MDSFSQVILDGATGTLILALVALGLAVIFGLGGVLNLGHGAMLTLGAYVTWACQMHGVPFIACVPIAAVVVGVIGLLFELAVVRHFYDRPFETLLITYAFYLIATQVIQIVWGRAVHNIPNPLPGNVTIAGASTRVYTIVVCGVCIALLSLTWLVMYRTSVGTRLRAMLQNREMASLLGIDASRTYSAIFATGAALAGLAGALISPLFSASPDMGSLWLVRSFFVVIAGGLGALVGGTLLGSAVISGGTDVFSLFTSQVFAQTVVFALAILILRVRPEGLLRKVPAR
ncbi:MAG: branched-chain amino acid transporter permease [Marmoricola sp.]|jgi:urea transport system permease protein|nr:branched-chain amino acid transporter permease [Marmoricola sp.]